MPYFNNLRGNLWFYVCPPRWHKTPASSVTNLSIQMVNKICFVLYTFQVLQLQNAVVRCVCNVEQRRVSWPQGHTSGDLQTTLMTLAYFNNSVFLTVSYESRLACDDRGHAVNTETQKRNGSACQVGSSGLPSYEMWRHVLFS